MGFMTVLSSLTGDVRLEVLRWSLTCLCCRLRGADMRVLESGMSMWRGVEEGRGEFLGLLSGVLFSGRDDFFPVRW